MGLFKRSMRQLSQSAFKKATFRPDLESLGDRIVPAVRTFTGLNASDWSVDTNWFLNLKPVNGDIVRLNTAVSSNMDIANLQLAGLLLEGNVNVGLVLQNDLTLNAGSEIDSSADSATISGAANLVLGGGTVTIGAANTTQLTINADITGAADLVIDGGGSGTVRVENDLAHTGTTTVVNAGLRLANAGDVIPTSITVGDGVGLGLSALLTVDDSMSIPTVEMKTDGGVSVTAGHNFTVADLTMTSGAVIGQGKMSLTNSLTTNNATTSAAFTIAQLNLTGAFEILAGSGVAAIDLQIDSVISGSGSLEIGGGTTRFGGAGANTYTGAVQVNAGTLELAKPAGTRAVGTISIGGSLSPSVLRLINSEQISNANHVTFLPVAGVFDLNGQTETVTDVNLGGGGIITIGDGKLTSLGVVQVNGSDITMGANGRLVLTNGLTASVDGNDKTVQINGGTIDASGVSVGLNVLVNTSVEVLSKLENGTFVKDGAGSLRWGGIISPAAITVEVAGGKMTIDATAPAAAVSLTGGVLSGTGQVGVLTTTGGTIQPVAPAPSALDTANLTANPATTFLMQLSGPNQTVRVAAVGTVNLNGAQLDLDPVVALPLGSSYTILTNDGVDPIQGTFAGLAEGASFTADGQLFAITYKGGDGNDVVLSRVAATTTTLVSPDAAAHVRVGAPTFLNAMTNGGLGGTVEFYDGNTLLGSATVQGFGFASINATFSEGPHSITAKYLGDADSAASALAAVDIVAVPELYAVGAGKGGSSAVTLRNADGTVRATYNPFADTFTGGVRVATADFNGDGFPDLIAGTGPGAATQVKILDGKTGAEIFSVAPFEAAFTGGVYVAAADMNGDGFAEFVITPDEGGGPRVRLFDGKTMTPIADFFGIDDPNFRGGARAAFADLNGGDDGANDLLLSAGFGGGPRVAGFDGAELAKGNTKAKLFNDFFAFEEGLRNGAFLAGGDLDGDGKAELVAGGGPGGGPRVTAFSGVDLLANKQTVLANFFAGDPNNRGGVPVGVKQLTADDAADVLAGAGFGGGSKVVAYSGESLLKGNTDPLHQFDAFPGFLGGVFVG